MDWKEDEEIQRVLPGVELQAYVLQDAMLVRYKRREWYNLCHLSTWRNLPYQAAYALVSKWLYPESHADDEDYDQERTTIVTPQESFNHGAQSAELWAKFLRADLANVVDVMDIGYKIGRWDAKDSTVDLHEYSKGFAQKFFEVNGMVTRRMVQQPKDERVDFG